MQHFKNISKDTGIDIEKQDVKIGSEIFKHHRNKIDILLMGGLEQLDSGEFNGFVITTKIVVNIDRDLEGYGDECEEFAQPTITTEEKITLKKEQKYKDELPMCDYELVSTDDGYVLIERDGLQIKMDLEGNEDKR